MVNSENRVIGIVSESDLVLSEEEADLHLPHFFDLMGGIIFTERLKGFEERLNKALRDQRQGPDDRRPGRRADR